MVLDGLERIVKSTEPKYLEFSSIDEIIVLIKDQREKEEIVDK